MMKLAQLTFAAALLLGLASSAQALSNNNNNGCNPPPCGNGGNGNGNGNGGCNPILRCDAGGPYTVNSAPGVITVQLNGLDSTGALDWVWNTTYPGAYFMDAAVPNPVLVIPVTNDCSFNVEVCLLVKRQNQSKTCCTTVRVRDHVKPVITCPDLAKVISGMDTSPAALGYATATDNCDQNVTVTFKDKILQPDCKADRFAYQIERTWKAVDDNCNVAKCVQIIDVVRYFANLDVMPGACPNLYNRRAAGTLSVTLVGAPGFDVSQVQWSSLRLYGLDCSAGPLAPNSLQFADTATPFINGIDCNCTNVNGDGTMDLVLNYNRSSINCAFNLAEVTKGETFKVVVIGKLTNGVKFIAQDCLVVQ
ncbi:MAG: hypothetical protein SGI72_14425 [Planctomycetota bacterium]|nr:hypothetical protein [Planctomycetota bacterium]